jgi:hypothetical protein
MRPQDIQWQGTGIEPEAGERIAAAIFRLMNEHPHAAIDVQQVTDIVGISGFTVKPVFSVLLSLRLLKATFMPRHRHCGRVIGQQEPTIHAIEKKAEQGEYGDVCMLCGEPIEGPEDIEMQIVFWRPGARAHAR